MLTDPATLRATADAVAAAAATLASLGDAAGEAKAHAVHATALARLGKIGACEAALDRALAAARRAGDRRRANAVLAGAPRRRALGTEPGDARERPLPRRRARAAHHAGRAGGRSGGAALSGGARGAARARRGGATHDRGVAAAWWRSSASRSACSRPTCSTGLIELLEGDAVAAERALRTAYDGLRAHGLGIDAAQAAALLGRALLAQGRAAEAEALSHESERSPATT